MHRARFIKNDEDIFTEETQRLMSDRSRRRETDAHKVSKELKKSKDLFKILKQGAFSEAEINGSILLGHENLQSPLMNARGLNKGNDSKSISIDASLISGG